MKLSNNSMSYSVMFAYTKPHYVLLDGLRGVVAVAGIFFFLIDEP